MLCSANLHHRAKFRTGRPSRSGDMAVYWFFKMAAVRHLGFQKLEILTVYAPRRAKMPCHAKFCVDQSNPRRDMAVFQFSRWRPSAILDFQKLKISTSGPIRRPNMRQHAKFREDRSNCSGDMAYFRFSRWRPSVGTLKSVELRLRAKLCRNRSYRLVSSS